MCDFRYAKLVYKYKLGLLYDEKIRFSELDKEGYEIRVVNIYFDNSYGYSYENKEYNNTGLSDYPFPTVYEFYNSGEYDLDEADCYEITKEKFEVEFKKAIEYCKEHNIKPYLLL